MARRTFEELEVGEAVDLGSATISREEIVSFAERYDPQPFHVEGADDAASMYEDIIASGWHTAAVGMRLAVDGFLQDVAVLTGRGVDGLRWLRPVRPDTTLHGRGEVVDRDPLREHPKQGEISFDVVLTNDADKPVLRMTLLVLVEQNGG